MKIVNMMSWVIFLYFYFYLLVCICSSAGVRNLAFPSRRSTTKPKERSLPGRLTWLKKILSFKLWTNSHIAPFWTLLSLLMKRWSLACVKYVEEVKDAFFSKWKRKVSGLMDGWNIDHWFRFGAGHCIDGYFLLAECTRHFNPVAGFNL